MMGALGVCFCPQDDILLEVEDLYYLLLDLPAAVDEDTASAIFNKKKQRLTLTVDVSADQLKSAHFR